MTREEVLPYMPPNWSPDSTRYKAMIHHFITGDPITETANKFGIHRVTLDRAVRLVRVKMFKDGWKQATKTRVVYLPP